MLKKCASNLRAVIRFVDGYEGNETFLLESNIDEIFEKKK